MAPTVYRVGDTQFVVTVERTSDRCVAELWRAQEGGLARVLDPDGTPFQATAAAPWQAQHRAVSRLESFLRERAYELHDEAVQWAQPLKVTWQLPA